jgi:hypothetical protein
MFQYTKRWHALADHAAHRIHEAYDFEGVVEDLKALELLVRNEHDAAELDVLIDVAGDMFGVAMGDYLHE